MTKETIESALSKLDSWRDLFTLLVVIGVAGEFIVGFRYSMRTKQLQAVQHAEDQTQAEAMGKLHNEAETARTTAESFRLDIAKANERAAAAQESAAQFNEVAERERLARIQLEARLLPRSIAGGISDSIATNLSTWKGIRVAIIRIGDTSEVTNLGSQIETTLRSAGWAVEGPWSTMGGVSGTGISVCTVKSGDPKNEAAADGLVSILRQFGVAAGRTDSFEGGNPPGAVMGPTWDTQNVAPVRIFVGEKP